MNHFLKIQQPSLLTGRKIASLSPEGLAIVPSEAHRGDFIYFLPVDDRIHLVVLRPCINTAHATKQEQMSLNLFATSRIGFATKTRYFTVIGTAWIEPSSELLNKLLRPNREFQGYNVVLY
jgi:hypothetical protein